MLSQNSINYHDVCQNIASSSITHNQSHHKCAKAKKFQHFFSVNCFNDWIFLLPLVCFK